MTMAEFNIRYFSLIRIEERKDYRAREIGYSALIGSHYDSKKLPKNKVQYWRLASDTVNENNKIDKLKGVMQKAIEDYKNRNNK